MPQPSATPCCVVGLAGGERRGRIVAMEGAKMTESDLSILKIFAQRVRAHFPEARVWAFGSRARGEAHPDSDLDVCVVVKGLDEDDDRTIIDAAWEVGFANDVIISTVTFSLKEFTEGPLTRSPIVAEIRRNGVAA